ncbi:glutamyl-tRNA reductase [Salisediminibacterium halotolerans]|uniref:Glutamyl-tRNA reductase n=1 Tax=Salisediminibacterium halotolerans TaxID=517425 RepID=A0A1H9U3U8_9BACI|nr:MULTISPECIES: glutamyl-tRNA reductase [Salisediminibacterium]RLJ81101.1 glutamyl-tRNA reductase [Actinophytocola xinjiangensis]RPE84090.1 glutamyl-tRNA reductase [Salisediminibacterium halotolerans]TWG38528.1 glutamyl-tRNA reductase [Salisediminibacterium halotolerans]SES03837.1 glutamyl-tRNA reductase [Salisediminibacterium haloalkalitolerans]GEL07196.1 glutamyl-tRNA reductase [Salisediminibacterium halotolerans]
MHILAVSLNYKTAPVEIREKFQFQNDLNGALHTLRDSKSILENVIVSTCNRTEIYVVADQLHTGRYYTKVFLSEWFGIAKEEFSHYLQIREDEHAIEHLLRVSCGLDSMVLGETQILGQVRESFFAAQNAETTGTIFNHLFRQSITLAKRAHSETSIGENAVSVSYAAVELGKKIFGDFSGKDVLVMGAGKMSELTAKHLASSGVNNVSVINRTKEKADELAEKFAGVSKPIEDLHASLVTSDILISSTGSNEYIIHEEEVDALMKKRNGRPLFLVDIAVPRDLDPDLAKLDNVYLYDIDDLQEIVSANLEERKAEAEKIELMIEEELVHFGEWLDTLGVIPVITALRKKAAGIQEETMASLENKLSELSERDKKIIRKHMKSIINQMLRDPITAMKEIPNEEDPDELLDYMTKVFALEDNLEEGEPRITSNININRAEREWNIAKKKNALVAKSEAIIRSF